MPPSFVSPPPSFISLPPSFISLPQSFISLPQSFISLPQSFILLPPSFIPLPQSFTSLLILPPPFQFYHSEFYLQLRIVFYCCQIFFLNDKTPGSKTKLVAVKQNVWQQIKTHSGKRKSVMVKSHSQRYLWASYICYCQTSNISHTLVGNKIADHYDVVGAPPVSVTLTTSSFST